MDLATLRLISIQERESGKITEICDSTFDRVREEIEYRVASDKEEDSITCEEIESYKAVVEDIFMDRSRKIIQLILIDVASGKCSTDSKKETHNLLPFEETAYEQMVQILRNLRGKYLDDHMMEMAIYKKKLAKIEKRQCKSCIGEEDHPTAP